MTKYKVKVDGMMCSMCEAHINDCVRKNFNVNKVNSSHTKGTCEIVADDIDVAELEKAINSTGYTVRGISSEPYEKKSFLSKFYKKS